MINFTPSLQQELILEAFESGANFIVKAGAGTGKTSSLKLVALMNPDKYFIYTVFNKKMQLDAKKVMPKNVECRTGDSLSWGYVSRVYQEHGLDLFERRSNLKSTFLMTKLDIFKHFKFEKYLVTIDTKDLNGNIVSEKKELTAAKTVLHLQNAIHNYCISQDTELDITHFSKNVSYPPQATADANQIWSDIKSIRGRSRITNEHISKIWALQDPQIDAKQKDPSKRFSAMMVDEAQDTNPVFGKVYRNQKIQRIYVGDQNQAIYGFRGAEDEMEKVEIDLKLDLTDSWRFGTAIAEIANKFLDLLDEPTKVIGKAKTPGVIRKSGTMENPNVVICRTNAGALRAIFERILAGQFVVVDSDYKKELLSLLDTIAWFYGDLELRPSSLHQDLEEYSSLEEVEEAIKDGDLGKKISELAELVKEQGHKPLRELLSKLNGHGKDKGIQVITAHKSKGGEWKRVQIYDDFWGYRYDYNAQQYLLPKREELMLAYVAITRAMEELDLGSLDYVLKDIDELNEQERQGKGRSR